MPKPGRPVSTILLNINQIEETVHNVILLCSNESVRSKVLKLCVQLYSKLIQTSSSSTQKDQMFRETSSDWSISQHCCITLSLAKTSSDWSLTNVSNAIFVIKFQNKFYL